MTPTWGCRDSQFGGGVKTNFRNWWKVAFISLQKESGNLDFRKFSFPSNLLAREGHPIYSLMKISGTLGNHFLSKRGSNSLHLSKLYGYLRLTMAVNVVEVRCLYLQNFHKIWWNWKDSFPANYAQTTALFMFCVLGKIWHSACHMLSVTADGLLKDNRQLRVALLCCLLRTMRHVACLI